MKELMSLTSKELMVSEGGGKVCTYVCVSEAGSPIRGMKIVTSAFRTHSENFMTSPGQGGSPAPMFLSCWTSLILNL